MEVVAVHHRHANPLPRERGEASVHLDAVRLRECGHVPVVVAVAKDRMDRNAPVGQLLDQGLLPPDQLADAVNKVFVPKYKR